MNKDFEKNYREAFDEITPDEGVREKILANMENNENVHKIEIAAHENSGKRIRRRQFLRHAISIAACLCLLATAILSDSLLKPLVPIYTTPMLDSKGMPFMTLSAQSYASVYKMLSAPSKSDIIANKSSNERNYGGNNFINNFDSFSGIPSIRGRGGSEFAVVSNSMYLDGYYSTTNLQVLGVDEADVVKTDGSYIYALRTASYNDNTGKMKKPSEIVVIKAEGKNSKIISRIAAPMPKEVKSKDGKTFVTTTTIFYDMYLLDERLVIIADISKYTQPTKGNEELFYSDTSVISSSVFSSYRPWMWSGSNETTAFIYDIKNKNSPVLIDSFGQSGAYQSSRLVNGVLYTITNHYVDYKGDPGDAELYIPQLSRGIGTVTNSLIPAADISIMSSKTDSCFSQFTVICAIGIGDKPERLSTKTLLGSTDTLYASGENLVLAGGVYDTKTEYGPYEKIEGLVSYSYIRDYDEGTGFKEQKKEGQSYRHVTQHTKQSTSLVLFSLNGGDIKLSATGQVPGRLLNQFSIDEYEKHFRIVTTVEDWVSSSFEDKDGEYAQWEWNDAWSHYNFNDKNSETGEEYYYSSMYERKYYDTHPEYWKIRNIPILSTNGLYVLDGNLKQVGVLDGLAEDERVYSVRFTGDIGYFVTYKQIDPLFTVDLSDPKKPHIRSELKIPGFSEYLHPYDEGLLLGLGQNTSINEWGGERRDGLKLSMFDVSDPDNVTEKNVLNLPFGWTEASSNHKAVLVSRARALIAFPADGSYAIYGYSKEKGFAKRAIVDINEENWWQGNSRGLFIGNDFYVISQNAIYVFSVSDFSELFTLNIK